MHHSDYNAHQALETSAQSPSYSLGIRSQPKPVKPCWPCILTWVPILLWVLGVLCVGLVLALDLFLWRAIDPSAKPKDNPPVLTLSQGGNAMFENFTIGPIRVILDADTGAIVAVQDAESGAAAAFMFSREAIRHAVTQAKIRWESTADAFV